MPYRRTIFADNEIYHIFNRGVARLPIFSSNKDYSRFIELIDYYRNVNTPMSYSYIKKLASEDRKKLLDELKLQNKLRISLLVFCLMPNHFHLLVQQKSYAGIRTFMKNLQNSYAKYYNINTQRVGPLYQSSFKAVRIETDEQLLHVSRYIHLNPSTAYIVSTEGLAAYPWSSLSCYITEQSSRFPFVDTEAIHSHFKNKAEYKNFVYDQLEYQRELNKIKHLLFN